MKTIVYHGDSQCRRENHRTASDHGGITIIELLVCIGVIGLLAAITIPAVQQSRAASRRLQCLNHLRQIGLATQNYVSLHEVLPGFRFTPFIDLLPQLELTLPIPSLHHQIHFPVLRCPGDRSEFSGAFPMAPHYNYLMNGGAGFGGFNGVVPSPFFLKASPVRYADITDGTSHTALFGERLLEYEYRPEDADPKKYQWHLTRTYTTGEEDLFHHDCDNPALRTSPFPSQYPISRSMGSLNPPYSHLRPPNAIACYWLFRSGMAGQNAAVPVTSNHVGGANIVLCDGHGRFVSDQIDIRVWRAVGSRNGSDSTGEF